MCFRQETLFLTTNENYILTMPESFNKSRKVQLMNTASKMFREKGYSATSMRDIANALGIEAASLYHYIKSKDELLENICFEMAEKFNEAIREVNDIYFNAEEKLRMAIRLHVKIITENLDQSAVFLNEWKSLREKELSRYKELRGHYENEFHSIIELGIREDVFDHVDIKFASLTILSSVNWIYHWYQPDGKFSPEEIATRISDIILGGLKKKLITEPNYKP